LKWLTLRVVTDYDADYSGTEARVSGKGLFAQPSNTYLWYRQTLSGRAWAPV